MLISLAAVRLLARQVGRDTFSSAKAEAELGVTFRPVEQTFAAVVAWFRERRPGQIVRLDAAA